MNANYNKQTQEVNFHSSTSLGKNKTYLSKYHQKDCFIWFKYNSNDYICSKG
jgi:hypothetical protein